MRNLLIACSLAALTAGCVTAETVQFKPTTQQQSLIRDGQAALVSRKPNSIVMIRPASRQFQSGSRPVFVLGLNNLTHHPIDFRVSTVGVRQFVRGNVVALKVFTFDELMTEERNRQVAAAIIGGLAVAANSYSAANAGRYNSTSMVTTPRGNTYLVNTSGYSPAAAAVAQANANAQNDAIISATIERGQQNMAALERGIIKDNTLLPGEWYGGQLVLQPPSTEGDGPKTYSIDLMVGTDRHEIEITQAAVR
jgi:hypothetical protein